MSGPRNVSGPSTSHTAMQDSWGSPAPVVDSLDERFGITGDMCACSLQHLYGECRRIDGLAAAGADLVVAGTTAIRPRGRTIPWLGPGHDNEAMRDALSADLSLLGDVAFSNPTYSNIGPFADRLVEYVFERRGRWGLLLVKLASGTRWYVRTAQRATEIWTFDSRLKHLKPRFDGMAREAAAGSNIDSVLMVFSEHGPGPCGPSYGILSADTGLPVTPQGGARWLSFRPPQGDSQMGLPF